MPIGLVADDPGRACRSMTFGSMAGPARRARAGGAGRQLAGRARAGRRRRRITPWNYPLHQIAAKVAPALAAGCTVVAQAERGRAAQRVHPRRDHRRGRRCRPASSTSSPGDGPVVGEAIAAHPGVDMVSFTGSTRAGKRVSASWPRRRSSAVALELGGKSPNVILPTTPTCSRPSIDGVGKCFLNSGQTCSALTRMLVPARAAGARPRRSRRRSPRRLTVGDPFDEATRARAAGLRRPARARARLHPARASTRARELVDRRRRAARGPADAATSSSRPSSPT